MKNIRKILILAILFILLLSFASLYIPFSKKSLNPSPVVSFRILDRNKILLREVLSDESGRCRWVKLNEISPYIPKAVIAAEDKLFFLHPGVNIFAVIRAVLQNIKQGRTVSGASTITQQLVRNIFRRPRNVFSKLFEAWLALRLERTLPKEEILVQYMNRIYFGNRAYGIEAASRLYYDKPSSDLSLAEAAFLAGLPRSPVALNPYRHFARAQERQKKILKKMYSLGFINSYQLYRALEERLNICPEREKFRAPHFCDFVLQQVSPPLRRKLSAIQTTLDYSLQEKVEVLVKTHVKSLKTKGISNAAVVVLSNTSGEILCMIGSKDFFDWGSDGQVNGALSLRQPGSTLKPFTYSLALENGMTAATTIEDREIQFSTPEGTYRPQNYDEKYHGLIRMRSALACSYNIPAVSVLQTIGSDMLYQRLKILGFASLKKSPSFYGIGLTLGNGEVALLELARAYSVLARGGTFLDTKTTLNYIGTDKNLIAPPEKNTTYRIFSSQTAYIITNILADRDARIPSFGYHSPLNLPFPCAAKTGTSKDFRDNWTIGYTPQYTVGVWVGNFDGKPMHNVSGISGSGPLFRDIMLLLEKNGNQVQFKIPEKIIRKVICPLSGRLPTEECPGRAEEIFIEGTEPDEDCFLHTEKLHNQKNDKLVLFKENSPMGIIKVSSPADGDIFKIDPILRKEYQSIELKASVPEHLKIDRVEWWLNNQKIGDSLFPFSFFWTLQPGFYTIKVTARIKNKRIESQEVRISILS